MIHILNHAGQQTEENPLKKNSQYDSAFTMNSYLKGHLQIYARLGLLKLFTL